MDGGTLGMIFVVQVVAWVHAWRPAHLPSEVKKEQKPKTAQRHDAVATEFLLPLPLAFIVPGTPHRLGLIPPVVSRLLAAWRHRHRTGQAAAQ